MTKISNPWVVCHKPKPHAQLRLFCFPYAGGGASIFRLWSQYMPDHVEVCAIQLPGRENRLKESPFTRLPQLMQALTPALLPYFNLPFMLFGHSMGAMIAFELARELRSKHGLRTRHLFVSGRHAPQLPDRHPLRHDLPEPEFVDQLRRFNGTPEEVLQHAELFQLVLPILRADFSIVETYDFIPGERLNCPITALGGLEDVDADRGELDAWREQTTEAFNLHMFPGDHFYLNVPQTREQLTQVIVREVSRIGTSGQRFG